MAETKDLSWVKTVLVPSLTGYEVQYKFFEQGDFGSLSQVEFNSEKIGAGIDFWGSGKLGIFVWDYQNKEQLLNVLLDAEQELEKEEAFNQLQKFLFI